MIRTLGEKRTEWMVKRTRIVLAGMSGMLLDIMEEIFALHPEFHVVGRVARGGDIVAALRQYRADVLVVSDPAEGAEAGAETLFRHRPARIVSIAGDGREGTLYVLRPYATRLPDLSLDALVAAISSAKPGHDTASPTGDC